MSAKNRNQRLDWAQAHQNRTHEEFKNIYLDFCCDIEMVISWHQEHKSIDSNCLVSAVQAEGGGIVMQ